MIADGVIAEGVESKFLKGVGPTPTMQQHAVLGGTMPACIQNLSSAKSHRGGLPL